MQVTKSFALIIPPGVVNASPERGGGREGVGGTRGGHVSTFLRGEGTIERVCENEDEW